jgi:hypothetical protein
VLPAVWSAGLSQNWRDAQDSLCRRLKEWNPESDHVFRMKLVCAFRKHWRWLEFYSSQRTEAVLA